MSAEYSNPTIPEGINTSERHPLRSFFVQSAQAVAVFAVLSLALAVLAWLLAPHVPFSWEQRLAQPIERAFPAKPDSETEQALRSVASKVAAAMDLPEGMDIKLRYSEADTVNAVAMPGGIVVVFRGLLEELESEDELAALLAHEIAHVQHRDVARGVLYTAAVGVLLSAAVVVLPTAFNLMQHVSALSFSRTQEAAADRAATTVVAHLYGHAGGAVQLFERMRSLMQSEELREPPELMASHPNFDNRIASVRERCAALPACAAEGTFTPLPAALVAVREQARERAKEKAKEGACKD